MPDDMLNFELKYNSLPDGTQYPAETNLEAIQKM